MKRNLLQKNVFYATMFVLLLSVAGMKNALAQNQVATLQHNDTISAFYGMNALVEAHAAATDGDIITLSSGTFYSTWITKAITLHGAGCTYDSIGIAPTIVSGNPVGIDILNDSMYLIVEGVSFQCQICYYNQLYNAKFIKCFINEIDNTNISYCLVNDVQFINCRINRAVLYSKNNSVSLINCVVAELYHSTTGQPYDYLNIYNSVCASRSERFHMYNSIIGKSGNYFITNSYAYNCIVIGAAFSNSVQTFNCMAVDSYSDVFESFDGTFSNDADFHLKEEISTTFLGNDGREVGVYGGGMPYKTRPSYMILKNCNVAGQTDENKKLNIEMELVGPDD